MKKLTLVACIAAAFGYSAAAQADGTAAPAAPSLGAVIAATPGLSLTGYVATSYTHFDTTPALRAFDGVKNGFTLNQAALTASYLPSSGAGASVTVIGGNDAQVLRSTETWPLGTPGAEPQVDIANAYAQYAVGNLTVQAGKFWTLAGAEVANPTSDNEISRSLLFWNMEPGLHTGVRAAYSVGAPLTVTVGVNNGFNFTSSPTVNGSTLSKTLELGASGTPNKMFSYSAAFYSGASPLFGEAAAGRLQLLDLVGTINATDALSFSANVDAMQKQEYLGLGSGTGRATGIALYANYALNDKITLAARGEYISDGDGIVTANSGADSAFAWGTSNKLKELTLAVGYAPGNGLKLSAEVRQDKSDVAIFSGGVSTQNSVALQAAYAF